MLTLYQGRPEDETGRLEKEIRAYDLLEVLLPAMGHQPIFVELPWT